MLRGQHGTQTRTCGRRFVWCHNTVAREISVMCMYHGSTLSTCQGSIDVARTKREKTKQPQQLELRQIQHWIDQFRFYLTPRG